MCFVNSSFWQNIFRYAFNLLNNYNYWYASVC